MPFVAVAVAVGVSVFVVTLGTLAGEAANVVAASGDTLSADGLTPWLLGSCWSPCICSWAAAIPVSAFTGWNGGALDSDSDSNLDRDCACACSAPASRVSVTDCDPPICASCGSCIFPPETARNCVSDGYLTGKGGEFEGAWAGPSAATGAVVAAPVDAGSGAGVDAGTIAEAEAEAETAAAASG